MEKIPKKAYYITMTDRFMSGWGSASGRISKFVIGCNTYAQAQAIARNARKRPEMKYVNIVTTKPHYNERYYHTSYQDFSQLGGRWKE